MNDSEFTDASIPDEYTTLWRDVLTVGLGWSSGQFEAFVKHWAGFVEQFGRDCMFFHDSPSSYIAPFIIPNRLRASLMAQGKAIELRSLESQLSSAISTWYRLDSSDWEGLWAEVDRILSPYSVTHAQDWESATQYWNDVIEYIPPDAIGGL